MTGDIQMKERIGNDYRHTIYACYIGFVTQAVVINFAPLLFVRFGVEFDIPLEKITLLATVNFLVQLITDAVSPLLINRFGYRSQAVLAHVLCGTGLILMTFLPGLFKDPSAGLIISVVIYSIGAGLIEVINNPLVESCPTGEREAALSLLHSFYCWGQVFTVIVSTLFFFLFGLGRWRILAVLWAAVPLINSVYFLFVPINEPKSVSHSGSRSVFREKYFYIFCLMMIFAGATEHAMCQWASSFTETALGVSKTAGDILGPCLFAACCGTARLLNAKFGSNRSLMPLMGIGASLCAVSFAAASISPFPAVGLAACGLCGIGTGILWPGTCSLASERFEGTSASLSAYLALAGDIGCSLGPTVSGFVSSGLGGNIRYGMAASIIFPLMFACIILVLRVRSKKTP